MPRRRRAKRSLFARVTGGLLSLVDALCEGVARAAMALLRALASLVRVLALGVWRLLLALMRAATWPFICAARLIGRRRNAAWRCERLTGEEFEEYVALILGDNGFREIELTRASGDQGVDVLAERSGLQYAIQCKNYAGAVGNAAVQEAYAGAQYYGCDVAVVVCPGEFTRAARELAASTGVELWDAQRLTRMMRRSGRRPRAGKRYAA